ncbi:MAG: heme lyase NrfEFG subunit NrfE, partial [Gammaproteobacteria bacterium]|nr:heme lyase NrfEFG subunit NrfE [Gammaproteobacteria bacterium]
RYTFQFEGTRYVEGPNFIADEATIVVSRNGEFYKNLYPQKRLYTASGTPTSHMGIDGRFLRDLFTTLGDQRENGAWSMTVYVKPFVRWIWIGTIFIALGGILAVTDKRYRQFKVKQAEKVVRAQHGTRMAEESV